ncbi:MAG: AAA family ATPase, partial [Halobacteriota archaeon]
DYTSFGMLDIDKECESAYFQHHRLLNDFCAGGPCDNRAVAKAVRPMLEGYLHRRFPGLVPKSLLFGQVVNLIRDATSPSPLVHAQDLVIELNEINDYAGQFHHDTNPGGTDTLSIVTPELKTFVTRALHVVHRGEALA